MPRSTAARVSGCVQNLGDEQGTRPARGTAVEGFTDQLAAAYQRDLSQCVLCEWRCGVNRLRGESGTCRIGPPMVASRMLHPAPPSSYTTFMAGCNFRCLHCQNWDIAHYPDTRTPIDGETDPEELARESLAMISSLSGRLIAADRLFFSGGSPTPSLPFVEAVVSAARGLNPEAKVNYDTNGFLTEESFERVLSFATSITFDIRAVDDQTHRAMTGAPAEPVLRNARRMAEERDKLWEFRVLVVPDINEDEVEGIASLLADVDGDVPVCFLAFRPNFVLDQHPGATIATMNRAVETARRVGLRSATWSGHPGIEGRIAATPLRDYRKPGAALAGGYAAAVGCVTHPRDCGFCVQRDDCPVKRYRPRRRT